MKKRNKEISVLSSLCRNKKAIELSVNFIVMIILAVVVLGFGIKFATGLFAKSVDISKDIDIRTQKEIELLLRDGSRFAIPFATQEIGKNDVAYFGVGILNALSSNQHFVINVEFGPGVNEENGVICDEDPLNSNPSCSTHLSTLFLGLAFPVEPNAYATQQVVVQPKEVAEKGTYALNVYCCYNMVGSTPSTNCQTGIDPVTEGTLYSFKKIYVKVK